MNRSASNVCAILAILCSMSASAQTPLGSTFTYQGQLKNGGSPANGPFTMVFSIWDDPTAGNQVGPTLTFDGAGGNPAQVTVTSGLFTVALDFGASSYNGNKRWLQITVNGTALTPRQELTAAPFSSYSSFASAPWASAGGNINYTGGNVGIGLTNPDKKLTVDGEVQIYDDTHLHGISTLELGADVFGKDINAGKIGYATFSGDSLDIVGAGSSNLDRKVKFFAEGGANFNGAGTFSGSGTFGAGGSFAGNLGIGTTSPTARLHSVGGPSFLQAIVESADTGGTWFNLKNTAANGRNWALVSSATGNGEGPGKLLIQDRNALAVRLAIDTAGNVGIGNSSPTAPLSLANVTGEKICLYGSAANNYGIGVQGSLLQVHTDLSGSDIAFGYGSSANLIENMRIKGNGNVGIGTNNPTARLHTVGGPGLSQATFESADTIGTWVNIKNTSAGGHQWSIVATGSGNGEGAGNLLLRDQTASKVALIANSDGDITVSVLEITGGSDIAEPFNINVKDTAIGNDSKKLIEPGMVVCIDQQHTGELILSTNAYDRTVAGVISGAGGVKPGMMLRQHETVADGKHPVALTGRVYCRVDADAGGPVKAGDLLTTSGTPGHAMRVSDYSHAQGAILGKAMSSLEQGKGLVLVLVTLQ